MNVDPFAMPPATAAATAGTSTAASRLARLMQRAESYRSSNQDTAAAACYESVIKEQPDNVAALLGLAELHLARGGHNPGRALIMRAVSGHLENPRLALQLVGALNTVSESALMVEIARQLAPPMWDSAQSLAEMAHHLSKIGAHELARDFARAGVARDANHLPSLYVHAMLDVFFGDKESAAEHAERCIGLLPGDPGSHWLLSRLRLPDAGRRIDRLRCELDRAADAEAQVYLAYALHNELHEQRDYTAAWAALEHACRVKRSTLKYTQASSDRLFAELRRWSADEIRSPDGFDEPRLRPVFVIGLHRSGTTLAERILSGHSQITAGGETYDLRAQLRRASGLHFFDELDPAVVERRAGLNYRAIGDAYLRSMAWRNRGTPMLTDKLPSNYFNVGFIARALPQARFIHLRRDPVDVGLSSLRTLFSSACPYSYDQAEYVAHYRHYLALMEHWRELLPDRILDVDYSELVSAPEASATRMAQFCGVNFEPAMLSIKSRDDAVATASSVMMRDGIRTDRGKVWKAYESQLQPMIDALGA